MPESIQRPPGDMPPAELRAALHRAADMVCDYLTRVGDLPVTPALQPGDVAARLTAAPPDEPEAIDAILDDYRTIIEPHVTHWNHPGFLAYFAITGSGPGILGELLTAGLNVNAMLWRTGPAPTELEERVCDWLRQMLQLPPAFHGHINDTASIGVLLALAAARQRALGDAVRTHGQAGRVMTVYCSDQAHSSVDKACITLGLGLENLRRVATRGDYALDPADLPALLAADRAAGRLPIAVVATAGTTSSNALDPIGALADLCQAERLWLHTDAAYGGAAAICPEFRPLLAGLERSDSIVVNPHKWLFTPVDCSVFLTRDPQTLRAAFALVPEYLRTAETGVTNLMDYGPQLGRRFRALKLWFVLRYFGVHGLQERVREHCRIAQHLAGQLDADPHFERLAPVPLATVCFRARRLGATPAELDAFNERLLARVNADGRVFLSHTRLGGVYALRVTVGNLRTTAEHVATAWQIIREARQALEASAGQST